MSWLLLVGFLKRGFGAIWTWLCHRSFWQLVCIALAIFAGIQTLRLSAEQRHSGKLSAQIQKIHEEAERQKKIGKQISQDVRKKTDEENRRIAGDAKSLRVSGPGKAVCPPAGASGHKPEPRKPDAPGPQVPPADRAAVPWDWLVKRAEQADLNRAEVLAWREWYDRLVAESAR